MVAVWLYGKCGRGKSRGKFAPVFSCVNVVEGIMDALDTLFKTIRNDLDFFRGSKALFMHAQFHSDLSAVPCERLDFHQYFKPAADILVRAGFISKPIIEVERDSYDIIFMLLPKNMIEARYDFARVYQMLVPGGLLICAGDNNAGGKRLASLFRAFGFGDIVSVSRNKARCVRGVKGVCDDGFIDQMLREGVEQDILGGDFISQPGIFGWNKIDTGSHILTEFIPKNLQGRGADFGSGYGYLSRFVFENSEKVEMVYCIDADFRSVELCAKNLQTYGKRVSYFWRDLTATQSDYQDLDFVVMNPPFHTGKKTDISVGVSFIETARSVLKKGGHLYMVSNVHLPYEDILRGRYSRVEVMYEGRGFKVHDAVL